MCIRDRQLYETLLFIPSCDLIPADDLETTFDDVVCSNDVTMTCVSVQRVSDKAHDVQQMSVLYTTDDLDRISLKYWSCRLPVQLYCAVSDIWRLICGIRCENQLTTKRHYKHNKTLNV